MSIAATVPVAHMAAVNAALEEAGFGPNNFSVPLRTGTADATHAGLHAWHDPAFLAALQAIPEVTVQTEVQGVDDEGNPVTLYPEGSELFEAHTQEHALEWSDPTLWHQNPVMKGDQRTHGGKLWESLIDYNVWEPPIGWREVVSSGYPEWVQPTGAHDAYNTGDRVSFEGSNYESVIDANVWSPTAYPQGWTQIP